MFRYFRICFIIFVLLFTWGICQYLKLTHQGVFIPFKDDMKDTVIDPYLDNYIPEKNMLTFYQLPKLQHWNSRQFIEVTSASKENVAALGDFSIHISYGKDNVVVFEEYGTGCVYKIHLGRGKTEMDTFEDYIQMHIDGQEFTYPLEKLVQGNEFPFLRPLTFSHKYPEISGYGTYQPICYQKYMKIAYFPNKVLPNLKKHIIDCTGNSKFCKQKIYSGVSGHIFTNGTKVNSFRSIANSKILKEKYLKFVQGYTTALMSPENHGPDKMNKCNLQCTVICPTCSRTLYNYQGRGTITAIKMRLFNLTNSGPTVLQDWDKLFITIKFDEVGNDEPQIKRIPLGTLFGVTRTINTYTSATMGLVQKQCSYNNDTPYEVPEYAVTGYWYFPMPFWEFVDIQISRFGEHDQIQNNILLCYQIDLTDFEYDSINAGYFHITNSYYKADKSGYKSILTLDNVQGHIVGHMLHIDSRLLKDNYIMESDHVLYVDDRKEASFMGTGIEDYFGFSHYFRTAENTTFPFVGNYLTIHSTETSRRTVNCFRFNILDPIPFRKSVQFIIESFSKKINGTIGMSYRAYKQLLFELISTTSYAVFYYGKKGNGLHLVDFVQFGNLTSEDEHNFNSSNKSKNVFHLEQRRFLSQYNNKNMYNRSGRSFSSNNTFSFYFKNDLSYHHLLLRREYYWPVDMETQHAVLWVNDEPVKPWYLTLGSSREKYSLREADLIIKSPLTKHVHIKLITETEWLDIAYFLYGFNKL